MFYTQNIQQQAPIKPPRYNILIYILVLCTTLNPTVQNFFYLSHFALNRCIHLSAVRGSFELDRSKEKECTSIKVTKFLTKHAKRLLIYIALSCSDACIHKLIIQIDQQNVLFPFEVDQPFLCVESWVILQVEKNLSLFMKIVI